MQDENALLLAEFWHPFEKGIEIVLATSENDAVSARTVSAVGAGGKVYFGTFEKSAKVAQIRKNPMVALCLGATQIRGRARIAGGIDLPENKPALDALRTVFAEDVARFSALPGLVIIEVVPLAGGFASADTGEMYTVDCKNGTVAKLEAGV